MTLSQTIGFYLALTGGTLSLAVISFCIVNLFLISKDKVNELVRGRRLRAYHITIIGKQAVYLPGRANPK